LKQTKPFASKEEEVILALVHSAARVMEPWSRELKSRFQLTQSQYNLLRILRGARPTRLACREIGERMVTRDPDITRLIDRLASRGLVDRVRDRNDRRVVEVGITDAGMAMLEELDDAVERFPKEVIGNLGPKRLEQLAILLQDLLSNLQPVPSAARR
jgi:DNA-binding MarR family transcriptional regulator